MNNGPSLFKTIDQKNVPIIKNFNNNLFIERSNRNYSVTVSVGLNNQKEEKAIKPLFKREKYVNQSYEDHFEQKQFKSLLNRNIDEVYINNNN